MGRKRLRPTDILPSANGQHVRVRRDRKGDCVECGKADIEDRVKRTALAHRDHNRRYIRHGKRSQYGCQACDVPLCKEGSCFTSFHSSIG